MARIVRIVLFIVAAAQIHNQCALHAQEKTRVSIPRTRASIIPPDGFTFIKPYLAAQSTSVFLGPHNIATMMISEQSVAFEETNNRFSHSGSMTEEGFSLLAMPTDLYIDGIHARKFTYSGTIGLLTQREISSNVYLMGDSSSSLVVITVYADTVNPGIKQSLEQSVFTIRWDQTKPLNPFALINFSIKESGDFHLQTTGPDYALYTPGGGPLDSTSLGPFFLLRLLSPPETLPTDEQAKEMNESFLQNIGGGMTVRNVLEYNKILVDGINGYETVALGGTFSKGVRDDTPRIVYVGLLMHPLSYLELIGITGSTNRDSTIGLFKEMTRSFLRKKITPADTSICEGWIRDHDYSKAVDCFTEALQLDPKSLEALLGRADALRLEGHQTEAIADYDAIIQHDATAEKAYLGRGKSYASIKKYPEAIENFSRALQLNSVNLDAYTERAAARTEFGDWDAAIHDYDHAIALMPQSIKLYLSKGDLQGDAGLLEESIGAYSKALLIDSLFLPAYVKRGEMEIKAARYDSALADFNRALRLNPVQMNIRADRGEVLLLMGNSNGALDDASAIILHKEIDTKLNRRAHILRAKAEGFMGRSDVSIKDFSQALSVDSSSAEDYLYRGIIEFMSGKYREAAVDMRKTARIGSDPDKRIWLYAAEARAYTVSLAKEHLMKYRQAMSGAYDQNYYADVRYVLGEINEDEFAKVAKNNERDPNLPGYYNSTGKRLCDLYFTLGMANYVIGLKSGAKKFWQECLETKQFDSIDYQFVRAYLLGAWKE